MNSKVISFQLADGIDIKLFKTTFPATLHYADTDELFYKIENQKYLSVFKYGIVCIVKENMELFKDLLQNRNSQTLEWVVIILILVEVINILIRNPK